MKNNKKGFTLAELLIVVAIIGVLVAVSIPIFTSQLEKARESTDMANLRAAKAAAVSALLTQEYDTSSADVTKYYNTTTGALDDAGNTAGRGTAQKPSGASYDEGTPYGYDGGDVTNKKIVVKFLKGGEGVTVNFEGQTGTTFGKTTG